MTSIKRDLNDLLDGITPDNIHPLQDLNDKLPQEKKNKESLRESLHTRHEDLHKPEDDDLRK